MPLGNSPRSARPQISSQRSSGFLARLACFLGTELAARGDLPILCVPLQSIGAGGRGARDCRRSKCDGSCVRSARRRVRQHRQSLNLPRHVGPECEALQVILLFGGKGVRLGHRCGS